MAITIQLKKILSKAPIEYGEAIDFEIATAKSPLLVERNYGDNSLFYFNGETALEGGTDFSIFWEEPAGTRWQAFDGDKKLGFIISRISFSSSEDVFAIYNEEIQAGMLLKVKTENHTRPVKLVVNFPYKADTIEASLEKARYLYENGYEQKISGMANNKYSMLCLCSLYEGKWYSNEFYDYNGPRVYPKMRWFSSWYKLLTGEFYKKDELFAMEMENGEKFYFSKALQWSGRTVADSRVLEMEPYTTADKSFVILDGIYGTNVAYLIEQFSQEVLFTNGTRLGFLDPDWNLGNDPQWVYPTIRKIGSGTELKINWRANDIGSWRGADGVTGFKFIYPSYVKTFSHSPDVGALQNSGMYGIDIFISPAYNDFSYKDFNEKLLLVDKTPEEWKVLLGRVLTFASTKLADFPTELMVEYGYSSNGQICLTGWGWFSGSTLERQTPECSTYYPNDDKLVNNFTSAEAWTSILDFIDPSDDPGPGPGPGPEPEPEKEGEGITIGTLAELAIKKGVPLLGYEDKLQPFEFMQEYLVDFENYDEDIQEKRGFLFPLKVKATKDETLEHFRKRSSFIIGKHKKELENLWKIANTTFDPAYNVEEHLKEEVKKTGSDTLQDKFAEQKLTDDIGARKSISKYGEQNSEQTFGNGKSSTEYGQRENETLEGQAGINSVNYQKKGSSKFTEKLHTDVVKTDEKKDLFKEQPHQDEIGSEKAVDVHTTAPRDDEHKQIYDNTVTRKYDRQGNVGTMSTPELLQKAADSVAVFDFYNKLYDIVLGELAWYSESGYDTML